MVHKRAITRAALEGRLVIYHYLGAGAGFRGAAAVGGLAAALAAAEKVFLSMDLKRDRRSFSFFATAAEIMRFCSRSAAWLEEKKCQQEEKGEH